MYCAAAGTATDVWDIAGIWGTAAGVWPWGMLVYGVLLLVSVSTSAGWDIAGVCTSAGVWDIAGVWGTAAGVRKNNKPIHNAFVN